MADLNQLKAAFIAAQQAVLADITGQAQAEADLAAQDALVVQKRAAIITAQEESDAAEAKQNLLRIARGDSERKLIADLQAQTNAGNAFLYALTNRST